MNQNPALGVFFHWLGGLASGSFYVPYRGVKRWSWETYWLVGGVFSWIIAPWGLGVIMTNELVAVIREAPGSTIFWCYFWGLLWGLGGLTFGLTMRYLGMSLGMAMVLGYCAAFGTLMPPIFDGVFASSVLGTVAGPAGAGGGAAGGGHDELHLVRGAEYPEQIGTPVFQRRAGTGTGADGVELFLLGAGGNHVVLPIFLLHDGRNADGEVQVLQLDAAHGEHHYLQQPVGHRAARVARDERTDEDVADGGAGGAGGVDDDCGVRELFGDESGVIGRRCRGGVGDERKERDQGVARRRGRLPHFCAVAHERQAHRPPWNRPNARASISDMMRMPAPSE